jgi:hypothetical protein
MKIRGLSAGSSEREAMPDARSFGRSSELRRPNELVAHIILVQEEIAPPRVRLADPRHEQAAGDARDVVRAGFVDGDGGRLIEAGTAERDCEEQLTVAVVLAHECVPADSPARRVQRRTCDDRIAHGIDRHCDTQDLRITSMAQQLRRAGRVRFSADASIRRRSRPPPDAGRRRPELDRQVLKGELDKSDDDGAPVNRRRARGLRFGDKTRAPEVSGPTRGGSV